MSVASSRASSVTRAREIGISSSRSSPTKSARVHLDYSFDCVAANLAEPIAAGKHDAVDLRPVVAARLVHRSFKRADLAVMLFGFEHLLLVFELFVEECFHLLFGPLVFPQLH